MKLKKRFLVPLVSACVFLMSVSSSFAASTAPTNSDQLAVSNASKFSDDKVVLSPGKKLDDVKAQIIADDEQARSAAAIPHDDKQRKKIQDDFDKLQNEKKSKSRPNTAIAAAAATAYTNSFYGATTNGNVLVASGGSSGNHACSYSLTGYCHAGIWESFGLIRTANTDIGVKYEDPTYWQQFNYVTELSVAAATSQQKDSAASQATSYSGSYSIATTLYSNDKWYCSKVAWRAYKDAASMDIAPQAINWVTPGDLYASSRTSVVKYYT